MLVWNIEFSYKLALSQFLNFIEEMTSIADAVIGCILAIL